MKPRIYKHLSLWHCRTLYGGWTGLGYTPAGAYADWVRLNAGVSRG
jgi:hypothetical protein